MVRRNSVLVIHGSISTRLRFISVIYGSRKQKTRALMVLNILPKLNTIFFFFYYARFKTIFFKYDAVFFGIMSAGMT